MLTLISRCGDRPVLFRRRGLFWGLLHRGFPMLMVRRFVSLVEGICRGWYYFCLCCFYCFSI